MKKLAVKIDKVEVIEHYDSRSHERVRFDVRCHKKTQEVMVLKVRKPLPGVTGGKNTFHQ